jgi:hypothetical protein
MAAAVKFGFAQTTNPTPSGINLWVRIFTVATSIFLAWISTANIVGPHSKDVLTQILGLALGLANGLAPLFGVQVSGEVPAKEVSAIDTAVT